MEASVMFSRQITPRIVGAWISHSKIIRVGERKKLQDNLPPNADVTHDQNGLKIEVELPFEFKNQSGARNQGKRIACAIRRAFGIVAGFCIVESEAQIFQVTRRG